MESCRKDSRRSSEVGQGRWKVAGKNRDKLQRSGGDDGKMQESFQTILLPMNVAVLLYMTYIIILHIFHFNWEANKNR